MITSPERPHVYYDCDYTLVRPTEGTPVNSITFEGCSWEYNSNLVDEIKHSKARGHVVVVWSQGGSAWAHKVVEALGITDLVDVCIAKPSWFADDKPAEEILDSTRLFYREF